MEKIVLSLKLAKWPLNHVGNTESVNSRYKHFVIFCQGSLDENRKIFSPYILYLHFKAGIAFLNSRFDWFRRYAKEIIGDVHFEYEKNNRKSL